MARINIPVNNIARYITLAPSWVTATGAEGLVFSGNDGNVFLEVLSSTTAQQFTVQTGLVVDEEWAVADTMATVSVANTEQMMGSFPPNIYNQPDTQDVYIDHAVNAILQFRAWRLTQ